MILVLLGLNVLGILFQYYFEIGSIELIDFNKEHNLPTFYSSLALLIASILLFAVAMMKRARKTSYILWLGLCSIFLFLSFDEIMTIHERLVLPTRKYLGATGFLYYTWVIPYGVILTVFLVTYTKFLIGLPRKTIKLFILSGSIFVIGAIGIEMIGGRHEDLYGIENAQYAIYYTIEEFLEMGGIALFIYAILSYMVDEFGFVKVELK
ncbi:MAG: hypothetical protein WBA74_23580 [Cyclobacteriaceae bacterium]